MTNALSIILIAAACFIVYRNSFDNQFVFDDNIQIKDNTILRKPGSYADIVTHSLTHFCEPKSEGQFYRPLQSLTLLADYNRGKLDPRGYHMTNTLLHLTVCLLLFYMLLSITKIPAVAGLAALLYTVHPIHTEAVTYISGRADSLSSIFLLLMLIFQERYWRAAGSSKPAFYVLMVFCFIAGLLSKELAIAFPLLLLFHEYCLRDKQGFFRFKPKDLAFYVPLILTAIIWLVIKNNIIPTRVMIKYPAPLDARLIMACMSIANYTLLSFVPMNLHMEYRYPPDISIMSANYSGPVMFTAIFAGLVYLAWRKARRDRNNRIVFFGLGWFMVALTPYLNIFFQLNAPFAEHWVYIPEMGLLLSAVYAAYHFTRSSGMRPAVLAICGIAAVIFSVLTIRQNTVWKDETTFNTYTIQHAPHSANAYNNLAIEYIYKKDYAKAAALFKKALDADPEYEPARNNLKKLENGGYLKK